MHMYKENMVIFHTEKSYGYKHTAQFFGQFRQHTVISQYWSQGKIIALDEQEKQLACTTALYCTRTYAYRPT